MFMILKTLTAWSHVVFVPFNRPQAIEYEEALWKAGIQTADVTDYRRLLKDKSVCVAIASRSSIAGAIIHRVRRINPEVKVVFDMVDAHFLRYEREYQISGNLEAAKQARRYRKLETRAVRAADLAWCASDEEKAVIAKEIPAQKIAVIPTIHELHDREKAFEERKDLLFVGNFAHRPNADAVHFFMRDVFPLIEKSLPNLRLYTVGDNPSAEISGYSSDRVQVTGHVPDLRPFWQSCRVFIAPLRFGAGTKGKVGDAMSYGLPLVTTSIGAEGFGLTHGLNAMIGDDPEGFAESVVQLYTQRTLWEKIAENSRRHIDENFTPAVIAQTINGSIQEVIAKSRA
jgi:glycosyltransferase involved in cell wall biosynthesis